MEVYETTPDLLRKPAMKLMNKSCGGDCSSFDCLKKRSVRVSPRHSGFRNGSFSYSSPMSRSDDEGTEDSGKNFFTPRSDFYSDASDVDLSSVSFRSSCETESVVSEPIASQKFLDFENDSSIWFPPLPEDENDEIEIKFFPVEDDDVQLKKKQTSESDEPMRDIIHGHFKALVSQLLQGENIENGEEWLDMVTKLAWQAVNFVKPDTSRGGSMDPGDYVKIKCIAAGNPSDSTLVKGVVCTKNIKHKRMTTRYANPRVLILGGALEYQCRVTPLASFDTLVQREEDHLKLIISKIEALRPNVVLVERSASPYAQEYLLSKDISLVLNVRRPLLERIARCTGALVCPSIEDIASTRCGHCECFRVERVNEEHENQKKSWKTLMHFEGCCKRLGCTVILKGARREVLKRIKHVMQYAVFAAYHLSLETSFLADEGAVLPKKTLSSSVTQTIPIDDDEHPGSDLLSVLLDDSSLSSLSHRFFDYTFDDTDEVESLANGDINQSILVSFSSRSLIKHMVCERSRLIRIKFYGSFDKPLGRYLRDDLFDQGSYCRSCNDTAESHVLCYTHEQGNLTISVRSQSTSLPGELEGKIWMWHRCLRCATVDGVPPSTRRVLMSDAAWGLSFGKFLELSFSNHATANRVAPCGHSLQKDCLRFYGLGNMIAFFRYSPINILDVILPNPSLEFVSSSPQDWILKETDDLLLTMQRFYNEVFYALHTIESNCDIDGLLSHIAEMKDRLIIEKNEYSAVLNREGLTDILEVNQIRRDLLVTARQWDHQLYTLDSLSPSNMEDIGSLTAATQSNLSDRIDSIWAGTHPLKNPILPARFYSFDERSKKKKFLPSLSAIFADKTIEIIRTTPYLSSIPEITGGARMLLPQNDNPVVGVYDDEPGSMIAFVLSRPEHRSWVRERPNETEPHFTASYDDDKWRFSVTCHFARQFHALRTKCCPDETDFVRSLSRCQKWIPQGGKSNAYFAKSLDERLIIKQISKTELTSFEDFSADYFKYVSESIRTGSPSCLAKIVGVFSVRKMEVIVMENLFYNKRVGRAYDLKGSARARYKEGGGGVMWDMNLVEALRREAVVVGGRGKRRMERGIWNDTSFLAGVGVVDYSLLVGVDEERAEMVVGIIDYVRQYTWDKHVETWVKASGILGGDRSSAPTIVEPVQYKRRFRKAMTEYFVTVPNHWSA